MADEKVTVKKFRLKTLDNCRQTIAKLATELYNKPANNVRTSKYRAIAYLVNLCAEILKTTNIEARITALEKFIEDKSNEKN